MTLPSDDIVTSLSESIIATIDTIPKLLKRRTYIYSTEQLATIGHQTELPHVFYYYVGMQSFGKGHRAIFDLLLYGNSPDDTLNHGNTIMPELTVLLHQLRKAMACQTNATTRKWELQSEIVDTMDENYMSYVQRWTTPVQIIN